MLDEFIGARRQFEWQLSPCPFLPGSYVPGQMHGKCMCIGYLWPLDFVNPLYVIRMKPVCMFHKKNYELYLYCFSLLLTEVPGIAVGHVAPIPSSWNYM